MIDSKIRIKLESFNHDRLNSACEKMLIIVQNTIINSFGIIPLPTQKRIYCVLRSPHVDKDSREHFEIRSHKRLMEIYFDSELNSSIGDLLTKASLTSGVFYKVTFSKVNVNNNY